MQRSYRVLTGPTAAGKTAWLAGLAGTRAVLAISADSRQVFRHMDIGTGKPDAQLLTVLQHSLIDVSDPADSFSVYKFLPLAVKALEKAADAGQEPWVVGGTGLYIRSLVERLPLGSPPRERLRAALMPQIRHSSAREVCAALGLEIAEPDNPVRVVRGTENLCGEELRGIRIYEMLGLTRQDFFTDSPADASRETEQAYHTLGSWQCSGIAVLDPGHEQLQERIDLRVRHMFESGLLEEVGRLRSLGFGEVGSVAGGIAYGEAGLVLDGKLGLAEAIESATVRTRQYAKRQRTYFRGRGWAVLNPEELDAWAARQD